MLEGELLLDLGGPVHRLAGGDYALIPTGPLTSAADRTGTDLFNKTAQLAILLDMRSFALHTPTIVARDCVEEAREWALVSTRGPGLTGSSDSQRWLH